MSDSQRLIDRHKLQEKRVRAKLTRAALARSVGLHPSYVSMLERGVRGGGPETLGLFADFFGCDMTELMFDRPRKAAA